MCGIVGFVDHSHASSPKQLLAMTTTLQHRGPDSSGIYFDDTPAFQVGLGHQRLSILDLSELGQQPMAYKHLHIVHNGEVYNFDEIKQELEALGYEFESHTDTEVILKAFHAWDVACVEKFRGMFAFVIYDTKQQKLFMFRDRAGVKPFYYHAKDDLFLFASELKAFHKHDRFTKTINKEVIPTYMQFGYIPAPYSIFKDTYKLKAGHYIEYDLENSSFETHQYWDVNTLYHQDKIASTEDEVLESLEKVLSEACSLRMISDVPVGVFLSGGIDSSLVTALLQKESVTPLKTFTIGFDESGYNEAEQAKEIASYLKTDHTEYYCSKADALQVIPELSKIYDEPFGDSSAIATILVSRAAKEKVSVVLSGDGGDETFCGYSKYFALNRAVKYLKPGLRRTVVQKTVGFLNEESALKLNKLLPKAKRQTNVRDKFQKFKRAINAESLDEMFVEASSYVDKDTVSRYLKGDLNTLSNTNFDHFNMLQDVEPVEQMMAMDYQTFMADDVLTKVDRATMSQSLEGREPLLDHKIIEYVATIPIELKYKDGSGKYLLKKVLEKYLPKAYWERPKSGFQVPLFEWLKSDLRSLLDKYLDYNRLEEGGIFDAQAVQQTLKQYYTGQYININELWFILMFEMWREEWAS
ncbi:asparagine synthase (glutamine-hydrolyzing) [Sulfurovum sp.]|uniref:asparagine synthase (glutamine-hydrolyzing) n=1 Tax=Sulfurovum sp. TaxID=1969726 RepID=UPI003569A653